MIQWMNPVYWLDLRQGDSCFNNKVRDVLNQQVVLWSTNRRSTVDKNLDICQCAGLETCDGDELIVGGK
jgi:hypothetical protein